MTWSENIIYMFIQKMMSTLTTSIASSQPARAARSSTRHLDGKSVSTATNGGASPTSKRSTALKHVMAGCGRLRAKYALLLAGRCILVFYFHF